MTSRHVTLVVGAEGTTFDVDANVARLSVTLRDLMDDVGSDQAIPVPNVAPDTMAKVVEWCARHASNTEDAAWCGPWVAQLSQSDMFDLMMAANYLNIKPLFDNLCETLAGMMKGKTPEEIRATFNIENDFTPEQEAEVRREHAWALD